MKKQVTIEEIAELERWVRGSEITKEALAYRALGSDLDAAVYAAFRAGEAFSSTQAQPWDDIIFHPDDPRAVVGQEYEFSDFHNMEKFPAMPLLEILKHRAHPFLASSGFAFTFIRPIKKPEITLGSILEKLSPEEAEYLRGRVKE